MLGYPKFFYWFLGAAAVLLFVFGFLFVYLQDISGLLLVYFKQRSDVTFLSSRNLLYEMAIMGLGLSILNLGLAFFCYFRERILSLFLGVTSFLLVILLFIQVFVIISVN
ncbi:MAG: hypothetical protein FJY91_01705 [Candidatus Harrisonbacteria bacterium]|nr:hypothetical protein [Candidatus Harrisonbacteria bacterium]